MLLLLLHVLLLLCLLLVLLDLACIRHGDLGTLHHHHLGILWVQNLHDAVPLCNFLWLYYVGRLLTVPVCCAYMVLQVFLRLEGLEADQARADRIG